MMVTEELQFHKGISKFVYLGEKWDETSSGRFEELVECESKELKAKVLRLHFTPESSTPTVIIELYDQELKSSLSKMLIDGGYARKPEV